jgi:hypothetical protein
MRAQIPEQLEAKKTMLAWLERHPFQVLDDIAKETCIPRTSLYFWINGQTRNFRTPAYVQAAQAWVKKHESELS